MVTPSYVRAFVFKQDDHPDDAYANNRDWVEDHPWIAEWPYPEGQQTRWHSGHYETWQEAMDAALSSIGKPLVWVDGEARFSSDDASEAPRSTVPLSPLGSGKKENE
jgi:hypothetical protein